MTVEEFIPPYLELHRSGELQRRVDEALGVLESCRVCPWECGINRLADEKKMCRIGRRARVASHFAHFGEEDCLRGRNGSGTIFFGLCNLRCVFCQNHEISQAEAGREVTPEGLASMMLELQDRGCHNINWVTPEHVVPQILEALPHAIEGGLRLPIVYNTSSFDSMDSLRWMEGIVSIYMPDFKYWESDKARKYLKHADYPNVARRVIREMHRQVGDLRFDGRGLAVRGVLVRHLVMPGAADDTRAILHWLAEEISPKTYVNIMDQYFPMAKVGPEKYSELNRRITAGEMAQALKAAGEAELERIDRRRSRSFLAV